MPLPAHLEESPRSAATTASGMRVLCSVRVTRLIYYCYSLYEPEAGVRKGTINIDISSTLSRARRSLREHSFPEPSGSNAVYRCLARFACFRRLDACKIVRKGCLASRSCASLCLPASDTSRMSGTRLISDIFLV